MKYVPANENDGQLHPELNLLLEEYRAERAFDPESYMERKVALINDYFSTYGLKTALVALSGGVDSALVAHILNQANPDVLLVTMPALGWSGVTDQNESVVQAQLVGDSLGLKVHEVNVTPISSIALESIKEFGEGTDWSKGQMTPYLRTSLLYSITALLTDAGRPGIVCGTTNLDEGGYLGYVGKMSDGAVDVQIISDLHKSEVYTLGRYLGVPEEVLNAVPKGDMVGSRKDTDIFGAPYDMVELSRPIRNGLNTDHLSYEAKLELQHYMDNLNALADYNHHKYLSNGHGLGYAVSLHVQPIDVTGGWSNIKDWEK